MNEILAKSEILFEIRNFIHHFNDKMMKELLNEKIIMIECNTSFYDKFRFTTVDGFEIVLHIGKSQNYPQWWKDGLYWTKDKLINRLNGPAYIGKLNKRYFIDDEEIDECSFNKIRNSL